MDPRCDPVALRESMFHEEMNKIIYSRKQKKIYEKLKNSRETKPNTHVLNKWVVFSMVVLASSPFVKYRAIVTTNGSFFLFLFVYREYFLKWQIFHNFKYHNSNSLTFFVYIWKACKKVLKIIKHKTNHNMVLNLCEFRAHINAMKRWNHAHFIWHEIFLYW